MPLRLATLVAQAPDVVVSGITLDSRSVVPGDLYLALPGATTHGARFARQAIASGAAAVLTDASGAEMLADSPVPFVVVDDPRAEMARLASEIYGRPGEKLALYGITGTTGKTSTSFLLAAGLAAAGHHVGTIGTLGFRLDDQMLASTRTTVTTPEAPDLQALLGYMVDHGADSIAMEVSSHALHQGRTDELVFDVAAFTNLGRDHLDYHATIEEYFQAKARLFRDGRCRAAVVNIDDAHGERLVAELQLRGDLPVLTTGRSGRADYQELPSSKTFEDGEWLTVRTPRGTIEVPVGLLGDFNLHNATTAVAMLDLAGVDLGQALPGLASARVPGRMQRVELGDGAPRAVVDFAHTPESVAAALASLPSGRKIAVLGCGGDRDQAKRAPMGAAAASGAAIVVVTDDNPRSEDPAQIRASVLEGARERAGSTGAQVIDGLGRRHAIETALSLATPDDWVVVLGKGHETGQQLADRIVPFDDVTALAEAWAEIRGS